MTTPKAVKSKPGIADGEVELPAFDREVLALHTMQDELLQREVLEMFLAQLSNVHSRIAQGPIPSGEGKVLAHTLRGAAATVGAKQIAAIASWWEEKPTWSPQLKLEMERAILAFIAEASITIL